MCQKQTLDQLLARLEANWPEVTSTETSIVLGIIRLNDLLRAQIDHILVDFKLSRAAFEVLSWLRSLEEPRELTPKELCEAILVSSGGMTKVLIGLEKEALIERVSRKEDKRSKFVRLTPKGEDLIERCMIAVTHHDKYIFDKILNEEESKLVKNKILKIINKITV